MLFCLSLSDILNEGVESDEARGYGGFMTEWERTGRKAALGKFGGQFTWLCLLAALCSLAGPSQAMLAIRESLDKIIALSSSAIVADILDGPVARRTEVADEVEFHARPVATLFGDGLAGRDLDCRYQELLGLDHGVQVFAPLISGSGIEFNVKKGDRIILLIGAPGSPSDRCRVLRIEPLDHQDRIRRSRTSDQ
jgi:hypothetical protein